MLAPWAAAVFVTIVVVALAFRGGGGGSEPALASGTRPKVLTIAGVLAAVVLILVLADPALPVLAVGLTLVAIRVGQRRLAVRRLQEVDVLRLLAVFLLALSLGSLARVWSLPGQLMATAGSVTTAALGTIASVIANNLPAAVLLGSRMPAHPRSLLFGLDIGPNLAVTGSLSAFIWWSAARSVGARPSAIRYSAVGVFLVPLTLAAALAAGRLIV